MTTRLALLAIYENSPVLKRINDSNAHSIHRFGHYYCGAPPMALPYSASLRAPESRTSVISRAYEAIRLTGYGLVISG